MSEISSSRLPEVQRALDRGFKRCLALCREMQKKLEEHFRGRLELHQSRRSELEIRLLPWARQIYEEMAQTMFEVLRLLQPEDFEQGKKVNFYFLPGYHSYFIDRRIFYRPESTGSANSPYKDFGVGLCGNPALGADLERYDDCSQARWYRRATMPAGGGENFRPGSPYHWLVNQDPHFSDQPTDTIASFTFTTNPSVLKNKSFPEHLVLNLARSANSLEWGSKVANMLNSIPKLRDRKWKFPDRKDRSSDRGFNPKRERQLRDARCMLISLWMHSVFRSEEPDWWEELFKELEKQQLNDTLSAISETRKDTEVACDWGDQGRGRPCFTTWTTVYLHPLVAPPPVPLIGSRAWASKEPVYKHNIGWATFLCSAPLSLSFISVVRPWIRTIYGTLRNAEVSVLLRNREWLERAAQMVRMLQHDIHRFMQDTVENVLGGIGDCDPEKIAYRRFVLLVLQAQSTFMFSTCTAPDPTKKKRLRDEFVDTLSRDPEQLADTLYTVALDIQKYRTRKDRARVNVPKHRPFLLSELSLEKLGTYVSCLLLIGEIVRNYCDHGPKKGKATLSVTYSERQLQITLKGRAENNPVSESFALLENFLDTLELGNAEFKKTGETYVWTIIINLTK